MKIWHLIGNWSCYAKISWWGKKGWRQRREIFHTTFQFVLLKNNSESINRPFPRLNGLMTLEVIEGVKHEYKILKEMVHSHEKIWFWVPFWIQLLFGEMVVNGRNTPNILHSPSSCHPHQSVYSSAVSMRYC